MVSLLAKIAFMSKVLDSRSNDLQRFRKYKEGQKIPHEISIKLLHESVVFIHPTSLLLCSIKLLRYPRNQRRKSKYPNLSILILKQTLFPSNGLLSLLSLGHFNSQRQLTIQCMQCNGMRKIHFGKISSLFASLKIIQNHFKSCSLNLIYIKREHYKVICKAFKFKIK